MEGPVLVTGGAGFVGSHVVDRLLAAGREVRIVDCLHPAAHAVEPDYVDQRADWRRVDLRDLDSVRHAVDGIGAVCHQASMVGLGKDMLDVDDYVNHNDLGTAVLLRALAERRFAGPFVLAGSMVVYGEGAYRCAVHGPVRPAPREVSALDAGFFEPPCPRCAAPLEPALVDEDAPVDPRNVYAATKLHQEHLCRVFAREADGVRLTVLRYHNVYGPRMPRDTPYAGVASLFRSALEAGLPPRVFEDGGQRRDFVHVRDVARANELALDPDAPAGTFNIASGDPRTVGELASALSTAIGSAAPAVTGEYRRGDVRHIVATAHRASAALGFDAAVAFDDGVTEFATAALR